MLRQCSSHWSASARLCQGSDLLVPFREVDSVCVDQQNVEERSKQVKRMAEIYSKATRVIVWLGLASENTSLAIECFNAIASHIDVAWGKARMTAVSADESWADPKAAPPFQTSACLAMSDFLGSSWFERLWIYQEIKLAAEGAVLLCGHQSVGWTAVRKAVYFLDQKIQLLDIPPNSHSTFRDRISTAMRLCEYGYWLSLQSLLDQTKHCKCSDPRDRILLCYHYFTRTIKALELNRTTQKLPEKCTKTL